MHQVKPKYSINIKPTGQSYTIKSTLEPDLAGVEMGKMSIVWLRQPPAPYEIEELGFNFNLKVYKCSSLDYQCVIVCKVVGEDGVEVRKWEWGPIQTFLYNRLSQSAQLRVNVLLFNQQKKCILSLSPSMTLINPQNNNKYQLTQQDIKSIHVKPLTSSQQQQQSSSHDNTMQQLSSPTGKHTIIVSNLFQRLILLKLFHEIPNGMYCYSMEVVEVGFADESTMNVALLAVNRVKYLKREMQEVTKSMYAFSSNFSNSNGQNDEKDFTATLSKFMKKSNESLTHYKTTQNSELPSPLLKTNPSAQNFSNISGGNNGNSRNSTTMKKEFLPVNMLTSWRKSPKESIHSGTESIVSGNSHSKGNDSRVSLLSRKEEESVGNNDKGLGNKDPNARDNDHSGGKSNHTGTRISIKQPKVSILSTEITSSKEARQHKVSFPEAPPQPLNLKSSQLLIKPTQFKSSLSLRRSQEQVKTPRMDIEESADCQNIPKNDKVKKKSASEIQVPDTGKQEQEKYVDEFENLLFEVEADEPEEMCLNDSFAKLEEEEQKENERQKMQEQEKALTPGISRKVSDIEQKTLLDVITPPSPSKSERNIITLKQSLLQIILQNSDLRQKNQQLKRQLHQVKDNCEKKDDVSRFQEQIAKMREVKQELMKEIEKMKSTTIMIQEQKQQSSAVEQNQEKQPVVEQKQYEQSSNYKKHSFTYSSIRKLQLQSFVSPITSPPRQSRNQFIYRPLTQSPGTGFASRRSQDLEPSSILNQSRQQIPQTKNPNGSLIFNSGDLRFMKFQYDPEYQKFRNNQSYSYQVRENNVNEEQRFREFGARY